MQEPAESRTLGSDVLRTYSICAAYILAMERYMGPEARRMDMSADRRTTVGIQHLTVVPENFEPDADAEDEADDGDGAA